jgi:hypothetical protein
MITVYQQEVDIVAAPITRQAQRSPAMDFSYSYFYEYTTVLIKKPDVNAGKWRTLIDPLRWEVLATVGLSDLSILTPILICLSCNVNRKCYSWINPSVQRFSVVLSFM